MKSNSEIISEIIETARKIERVQIAKDEFIIQPTDGKEASKKARAEKILDFDFEICTLGEKLNTFKWLFEDSEG